MCAADCPCSEDALSDLPPGVDDHQAAVVLDRLSVSATGGGGRRGTDGRPHAHRTGCVGNALHGLVRGHW